MKIDLFCAQILIIVIVFNSLIAAANTAEQKSYCDAWARYILADIMLGGPVAYYKGFPEDPILSRAA